jgi:hypothetical protein
VKIQQPPLKYTDSKTITKLNFTASKAIIDSKNNGIANELPFSKVRNENNKT